MIVFPALAAVLALACAAISGFDAIRRPRPERVVWTIAFIVFAIAAGAEVLGQTLGWSANLARVYYLTGAVLVVGILALGELYLLLPARMPAVVPGISLLVVAIAATAVWSAPIDMALLPEEGWRAITRGPFLVALAAAINAGGTIVLAGGALYSAWRVRSGLISMRRAAGCVLIAVGTLIVAAGGTLTRFGQPDYLYLAMAAGIATIFAGVVLTRSSSGRRSLPADGEIAATTDDRGWRPAGFDGSLQAPTAEGVRFVTQLLLENDAGEVAELCRQWSATPVARDALTRAEAQRVWTLRCDLPEMARHRLDALPVASRAQLSELYTEVWSRSGAGTSERATNPPAPLSILPVRAESETREHEHV